MGRSAAAVTVHSVVQDQGGIVTMPGKLCLCEGCSLTGQGRGVPIEPNATMWGVRRWREVGREGGGTEM